MEALNEVLAAIGRWGRSEWLLIVGAAVVLASAADAGSKAWGEVRGRPSEIASPLDQYALAFGSFDPLPLIGLALGAVLAIVGFLEPSPPLARVRRPTLAALVGLCTLAGLFFVAVFAFALYAASKGSLFEFPPEFAGVGFGAFPRDLRITLALSQTVAFVPLAVVLAAAAAKALLLGGFATTPRTRA